MCTYILLWISIVPHHSNLPSPQPMVITSGKVMLKAEQPCNKKQTPNDLWTKGGKDEKIGYRLSFSPEFYYD